MELKEYLKDLEYLVNIDSGSEDTEGVNRVADFFEEKFRELGWIIKRCKNPEGTTGDCLICVNREAEQYDLLMIGHMDTVFPRGTCEKFPFSIKGDMVYGPGSCDMKHGSLLMYYLMRDLMPEINDKMNIVIVFNPDEEIGSIFSKTVYAEYAEKAKYAFVYEAANENGRCSERKGCYVYTVQIEGRAGHCGYVETNGAISAIHEMGRWIVSLEGLKDYGKGTMVNVGLANGGEKKNVVAPFAELSVDFRFSTNEEFERIGKAIENLKKESIERGYGINITYRGKQPFVKTKEADEYLKHVEEIAAEAGVEFKHAHRGGVSDANIISKYGVICVDGMGPYGDKSHCLQENMDINSIMPAYDLSALMIRDIAQFKRN